MQAEDNSLRIVKMDFMALHSVPWNLSNEEIAYYELVIAERAPIPVHETHGDRLTLVFPSEPVEFPEHQTVLLQILNTNKLWVKYEDKQHDPVGRNLHKLEVIVWGVSEKDHSFEVGHEGGVLIKKLDERVLSMILDQEFVVNSQHCYQKNHLGAVMTMQQYQTLKERSDYLRERTETMLELFHVELWLGRTEQQALESERLIYQMGGTSNDAFYGVHYAQASVTNLEPTLCNTLFGRRANIERYPRIVDFFEQVYEDTLLTYLTNG